MPWLMERVEEELEKAMTGRTLLDALIRDVVTQRKACSSTALLYNINV
jgi:hypothetical protein